MPRYAVVNGSKVENTILAEEGYTVPDRQVIACHSQVGPGWSWNGNAFAPPPQPQINLDEVDQATLNNMLTEEGSVVRALIAVMREEINALRTHAVIGLPPRTVDQVKAALKSRMRTTP